MPGFFDREEVFLTPDGGLKAEDIERTCLPPGFFSARLDGAKIKTKRDLLTALAAGLKFPAYFGYNWDALLDCLRSLPEFMNAGGYAVIIEESGLMLEEAPAELEAFRETASSAAGFLMEKYKLRLKIVML
jgi:hypothetical protein